MNVILKVILYTYFLCLYYEGILYVVFAILLSLLCEVALPCCICNFGVSGDHGGLARPYPT
jgi:hypothetical protein